MGTFGDAAQCLRYFRGLKYNGPYNLQTDNNGVNYWSFPVPMRKLGLMRFKVNVTNVMSQAVLATSIAVAQTLSCAPPLVTIANVSDQFYAPTQYKRSDMIVIESNTVLQCGLNQNHVKRWYVK